VKACTWILATGLILAGCSPAANQSSASAVAASPSGTVPASASAAPATAAAQSGMYDVTLSGILAGHISGSASCVQRASLLVLAAPFHSTQVTYGGQGVAGEVDLGLYTGSSALPGVITLQFTVGQSKQVTFSDTQNITVGTAPATVDGDVLNADGSGETAHITGTFRCAT
jgi:hypothetical protein